MKDVKKLRKICNLTSYEMAQHLGIGQSNYCNIENGKLIPNNLDKIRQKAIKLLMPLFDLKLVYLSNELDNLKEFREKIQ